MDEPTLTAIATARAFQQASQAQRVVVILDRPDQEPAMIEVDEFLDAEVTEGEHVATVPHNAALNAPAKPLPDIRPTPHTAIDIDLDTGELSAPLGTVEHLRDSVLALAAAFGGLTVASAEFATNDPETPITFAARVGEPVVLGAGDAQFEL
ncbi:hypothetical protein DVA67_024175 [Solirubrobacter sp. CPCC 204708]|uniref:Uncharacterized protein n=1 Tax=Solirubrobacter deserti TaxID=2282478 RepID=A0ABT4RKU2_9ACTN|nr:hypothetical protein [Solirubrobacter deserti]MBE2319094.1 hypothetical protein [Solirubrobacter deserti]MDA0139173.1 hypothetical protein [Solirubrobacter deserti]